MKKILFVFITVSLFSCKKEKSNCYMCQVIKDSVMHEEKMCGNPDGLYKDAEGNDLQCVPVR